MATQTLPEAEIRAAEKKPAMKYVYFFGGGKADGNGKMKDELGGKGGSACASRFHDSNRGLSRIHATKRRLVRR
jgi:hypothetical protein